MSRAPIVLSFVEIMREKGVAFGLAAICRNGGNGGSAIPEVE